MLAISPLESLERDGAGKLLEEHGENTQIIGEFSDGNSNYDLLDSIDFDDIFDGDALPDLETDDMEMLVSEFSASGTENDGSSAASNNNEGPERDDKPTAAALDSSPSHGSGDVETMGTTADKGRKSSSSRSKSSPPRQGKQRKVKVDWTPELHRRFVEAVEKLGLDKAVPSRILELMATDSLTRHNIASHLQKYRSHRKHLLAREAETASWKRRWQMYTAAAAPLIGSKGDAELASWAPPAVGFPSLAPAHHYRPLHVWGHPTVDWPVVWPWPNHIPNPPPLPLAWATAPLQPPSLDPSHWHAQHHQGTIAPTHPTPFFGPPAGVAMARLAPAPPVPGIPPPMTFRADHGISVVQPPPDFHPSKETIDAAIRDVLSKPWLPLPLGLKPPSIDGVLEELQRQGFPKIPPSSLVEDQP